MTLHVALHHLTRYRYDRPVGLGPQVVRLRPAPHCRTRVLSYSLRVTPAKHFLNWQQDPQSNYLARLVFPEPTTELVIEADLVAEMAVVNPFDFFLEPSAQKIPFAYPERDARQLAPYLEVPAAGRGPLLDEFLATLPKDAMASVAFLVEVNRRLNEHIRYVIRLEPGLQSPEETLEKRSGSCRDSAWLLALALRRLGLAARFVSGYLIQLAADVPSLDGPSGPSADFTDLHAWCEVFLPGAGWIGLDPTSGLFAGEGHLPLACSAEPELAAPVTGSLGKCEVVMEHEMHVRRIVESARVTKPYTDAQWDQIDAVGRAVDKALRDDDVRLTMGGEPTFISIDDHDSPEWNTDAQGPTKKQRAEALYWRLKERYAPRGLAHFGQGKQYPGEPLPRWSLACFFRNDGEPIWLDPALFARESAPPSTPADEALAATFLRGIAARLGLAEEAVFPAYEDAFYAMWRERRLPINVTPADSKLEDPLERARIRRLLQAGLDRPAGHVLPLAADPAAPSGFRTGPWFFRDEVCYLLPGDSPVGFRLPLDALAWAPPEDREVFPDIDPAADLPDLPAHAQLRVLTSAAVQSEAAGPRRAPAGVVRTAMCTEARNGILYVFMPPLPDAEAYFRVVSAVEATAAALGHPVLFEGYEPPSDPRVSHFRVTPDPGVIEVNIHPAASWEALCEQTTFVYEAARQSRLTAEKFMIDGRHTGTGGGNHMVLGGASAADSPFLRRPDLLRSLLSYWLQHPSLSYLFSGLFIGPTSQSPRVDEARHDAVFELEIAFREMDRQLERGRGSDGVGATPPWLVDRLLRHLLVDVTGNTHRTEICIDKLFSPDSVVGRRGLVEMRAFEMPPHAKMSLATQALLRALVARFWRTPYRPARLARWGTALTDRFMLPYFVWNDFCGVLEECQSAGFGLLPEHFAPHFEFRFPKLGDFAVQGATLEIRTALEPWHVLGEEAVSSGTARFVDSSLERLQVHVTGLAPDRYVVAVNGRALPLRPTGASGEYVAGVRFRAWQPPSCLHPTIGVHSPLTFDLVDTWMERSIGGCQVHVAHPGGRSYDTFPVNAFEAEGRRLSRFFRMGHTPGACKAAPFVPSTDFPFTLDMRFGGG